MQESPRILVVDDDPKTVQGIADFLNYIGMEVLKAYNGSDVLEIAIRAEPDLIILDLQIPGMDGFQVCSQLKGDPKTRRIPILMLTVLVETSDVVKGLNTGADDYLTKPYENLELEARVKALLRRTTPVPFSTRAVECTLFISCKPDQRIDIRISGIVNKTDGSQNILVLDTDLYGHCGEATHLHNWRFDSKQCGKSLYKQLFVTHPEVLSIYNQALAAVRDEENLRLRFECPRGIFRVPLEFLFDSLNEGRSYLVLRHSMARVVTGVQTSRTPLSPDFFNDLWYEGGEFKILLIASSTVPAIPNADQEIEALSAFLKPMFNKRGVSVQVDTLFTNQASYDVVRKTLRRCKYHIIHYAGHGSYDENSPEKSYLSFWERPNQEGSVKKMPISELQLLLQGSEVLFTYLSCCWGARTGEQAKLLEDDFLGIADGIIQAGIPSVLGFRWPVSDNGAKRLSLAFYESLAKQGHIDTALLEARQEIAASDRDDITWLSPILIMQA